MCLGHEVRQEPPPPPPGPQGYAPRAMMRDKPAVPPPTTPPPTTPAARPAARPRRSEGGDSYFSGQAGLGMGGGGAVIRKRRDEKDRDGPGRL